jgi:hypothetical protein
MRKGPLRNEVLHPLTHYLIVHPDCPCNCWMFACGVKAFTSLIDGTRSRAVSRQRDPLRRSEGPAGH